MRLLFFAPALTFVCGCTVDAVDDSAVFMCNAGHTELNGVNHDCGPGFACFDTFSSLGFSFCTKQCDADGSCPPGYLCSGAGGCLKSCDPGMGDVGCPMPLRCITVKGTVGALAGACLPVAGACRTNDDCTSAVDDWCFTNTLLQNTPPDAGTPVSVCLQFGCNQNGAACAPGSTCLRRVLPSVVEAPDICGPDCDHALECGPSLICMAKSMPASNARICIPGFYNFRCQNDLSCFTAGSECAPFLMEAAPLQPSVCAVSCGKNADCAGLPIQQGTPTSISTNACRGGHCTSFDGLALAMFCLHEHDACGGGGTCTQPPAAPTPDGGAASQGCSSTGGTSGAPPFCLRDCAGHGDCVEMEKALGTPMTCLDVMTAASAPFTPDVLRGAIAGHPKFCAPRLPGLPCDPSQNGADGHNPDCLNGLTCIAMAQVNGKPIGPPMCTKPCNAANGDLDCVDDDRKTLTLGPGWACGKNLAASGSLCVPRTPSGRPPILGMPSLCMEANRVDAQGNCVSQAGVQCDSDSQCASSKCDNQNCTQQGRCAP